MALLCAAIRRDSLSLYNFTFLYYVHYYYYYYYYSAFVLGMLGFLYFYVNISFNGHMKVFIRNLTSLIFMQELTALFCILLNEMKGWRIREWAEKFSGWKVQKLILYMLRLFFTKGMQERKKCVDCKRVYAEKHTLFDHIPWDYQVLSLNFSSDPRQIWFYYVHYDNTIRENKEEFYTS